MSQMFSECVEALLAGEVICEISNDGLYRFLEDGANRDEVNSFLYRIDRILLQTGDKAGYYCGYNHPELAKQKIRRQFDQVASEFDGLVQWLRLARSARNGDRPLVTADELKEADLLEAIEDSPHLQAQLADVAHKLKAGRIQTEAKQKLRAVLEQLADNGYLHKKSSAGSVYAATAKWSLLYEQLEFVRQFEGIDLNAGQEVTEHNQGELF